MTEQSAYTFSYFTDLTSAAMRTNNQQGELFRQLALAMPSGDQKCPSQPSEPAERKRYRLKRTALRNACIANLRACLLFSSIRVSTDFGARHNHNINLCGTESECASMLWFNGILLTILSSWLISKHLY